MCFGRRADQSSRCAQDTRAATTFWSSGELIIILDQWNVDIELFVVDGDEPESFEESHQCVGHGCQYAKCNANLAHVFVLAIMRHIMT